MRRILLSAVATSAVLLAAAPGAQASETTLTSASCTSTALVQPLLAPPACSVSLPCDEAVDFTGGNYCTYWATAEAKAGVALGVGGHVAMTLTSLETPPDFPVQEASCTGSSSCTAQSPVVSLRVLDTTGANAKATCDWSGKSLALLDRITCTLYRTAY